MADVSLLLFLISSALFVLGLVRPHWVLFGAGKASRMRVAVIYTVLIIVFFVAFVFTVKDDVIHDTEGDPNTVDVDEQIEHEQLAAIALVEEKRKDSFGGSAHESSTPDTVHAHETEQSKAVSDGTLHSVLKVVDGDTVSINYHGEKTSVRLIGVDTPETVHPSKPVQCFGREASAEARDMLSGREVLAETDPTQGTRGTYGRLLAYVYLPDGTFVNEHLIRQGYGHEYTYNIPYTYQAKFRKAETDARINERGLWAPGACEEESESPEPQSLNEDAAAHTSTEYMCSSDTYNCGDFSSYSEAQSAYDACGGVDNDIHGLDADKDGNACESLP